MANPARCTSACRIRTTRAASRAAAFVIDVTTAVKVPPEEGRRGRVLKAMADCAERLLRTDQWRCSMPQILEMLGRALEVHRVYIFENRTGSDGDILTSLRYEWSAEGTPPQIDNAGLQDLNLRPNYQRWIDELGSGRPICGDVATFPVCERPILESQQIVSIIVVPIFVGQEWWGFMGFDSLTQRDWLKPELEALLAAAHNIGSVLLRMRTADELRRFEIAFEQTVEAIVITDTYGLIQYANPAWYTITGCSRGQTIGKPFPFLEGADAESPSPGIWPMLLSGRVWSGPLTGTRPDGTEFHADSSMTPVRDEAGNIVHIVAVMNDITERIAVENQLQQAQKMEAIGQLAGGIAHDFNNLLQVIRGYVQLILHHQQTQEPLRDHLEKVEAACDRASELIHQLLTFGRRQVLRPVTLDLNRVIDNLLRMLHRLLGEHIELQFLPAADLATIEADATQIEQILINLCVNARDAMPQGGSIHIRTENLRIDRRHRKSELRPGNYVRLIVADNGIGIKEEHLPHIYEPFFTTKEVGRGTGLGLATVYGIVRRHEGRIQVETGPGRGATFTIDLPASSAAHQEEIEMPVELDDGNGGETILIAEDDEMVRKLGVSILSGAGYRTLVARDGQEAVEIYRNNGRRIDLILMDIVMPRMTGRQAFEAIREIDPSARVLFCTGYGMHLLDPQLLPGKDYHLIHKPFKPRELLRRIRSLIDTGE